MASSLHRIAQDAIEVPDRPLDRLIQPQPALSLQANGKPGNLRVRGNQLTLGPR
jgi:hypothetical protein